MIYLMLFGLAFLVILLLWSIHEVEKEFLDKEEDYEEE